MSAGAKTPLRLGQIEYLNVVPMHWALDVEPTFNGVPTEVTERLLAGDVDVACISSIEWARHAEDLELLPSLCVASDGAVGSIFCIASGPLDQVRTVHATPASATSVVLLRLLLQERGVEARFTELVDPVVTVLEADPHAAVLLIGDDAMRARSDVSLVRSTFTDLGAAWREQTGLPMAFAVWAVRREAAVTHPGAAPQFDRMLVDALRSFRSDAGAIADVAARYGVDERAARDYFTNLEFQFGPRERAGLARFCELAVQAGLLDEVPELPMTGAPMPVLESPPSNADGGLLEWQHAAKDVDVDGVLQAALRDERISEVDATALLLSGRLVDVGRVAHELRMRRADPEVVTYIVDRNINYTNICITDCGFCAFYRRPGDDEGYLHDRDVIFRKIQETIDLGGTAALMQGGHHPDLDVTWYADLFGAIKERFPSFHLHALSPPEIEHIARRSRMTTAEVLSELRDAGLDSLPGGGAEMLVDRVRRIIAPRKTKATRWLAVMKEAHGLGMSTTASMMYGHVETIPERVEHMRRVREVQDQTRGFRAFISWTFQPGNTPLAQLLERGEAPLREHLPHRPTPVDYLMTQAVSRIYLDNVDNIQSSWVTQGMKVGQAALFFGANDLGSIMIEENVVSSAGTTYRASVEDFVHAISAAGFTPIQRDTLYRPVLATA